MIGIDWKRIATTGRRSVGAHELQAGAEYRTSSGLGGSFTIRYEGTTPTPGRRYFGLGEAREGDHYFVWTSPGWESWAWRWSPYEIDLNVFRWEGEL
jgi:hypothetical protein